MKPAGASLIRPQVLEDSSVVIIMLVSAFTHAILLGLLIHKGAHKAHSILEPAETSPELQVIYEPPSRNSTTGPQAKKSEGEEISSAASHTNLREQPPENAEAKQTKAVPTLTPPSAPPLPDGPSSELPQSQTERPVSRGVARRGKETQTRDQNNHASHRLRPKHSDNPFANVMPLDFGQPSFEPRGQRGHRGGSGSPIDMSLGPLAKNGQINAPFKTSTTIRGVNDVYGGEILRAIRRHLFYPEDALANGEEGPSSVHIVLERSGRVRSVRLTGQSGSYSLDAATVGLLQGRTLPPVPPDMEGDHFDIDLTIYYSIIRR